MNTIRTPALLFAFLLLFLGSSLRPPVGLAQGDVNGDGFLDIADLIALLAEAAGNPSPPRQNELDVDQSGFLSVGDSVLLGRVWLGTGGFPVDLTLDSPPPTLTYTRDLHIDIAGTVAGPADLSIGPDFLTNVDGPFAWSVNLKEGMNLFEIRANPAGKSGPTASQTRTVVVDLNPPQLTVSAPAPDTAYSDDVTTASGTATDLTPVTITVLTPAGSVETTPGPFGEWSVPIPLVAGVNGITIRATDAAGLTNEVSYKLRSFLSPAQTIRSPEGMEIVLPEGALPNENMVVQVHEVQTNELQSILGIPLMPNMPPGATLDDLNEGVIIMPAGMMMEVENGPENGEPLFQRDVKISVPNVTNADNSMPIWIFQIQPDIDGDGKPQLALVSRGQVSDDGTRIEPVEGGTSALDQELPGPMDPGNHRFAETQLEEVAAAAAIRSLQARIRGEAPVKRTGANVATARPRAYLGPPPGKPAPAPEPLAGPGGPANATPGGSALVSAAGDTAAAPSRSLASTAQQSFFLLVDDFEDGNLLNLLEPPSVSYTSEVGSTTPDPTEPIRPIPLLGEHLVGEGRPDTGQTPGVIGGIPLRGRFGPGNEFGEAHIVTGLLGRDLPLNLSGVQNLAFQFDTRGVIPGATYEVTLEDRGGPATFVEFTPLDEWRTITLSVGLFGDLNVSDLRRIRWRVTDERGMAVDLQIDNPAFLGSSGTPPPPPTDVPTPTPAPTIVDPTPPPSPTPAPTTTSPPPRTPPPDATPPPPPPGESTITPTSSAVPTVSPAPTDEGPQGKTQVTFYCCAASAIIPYTGSTDCDDDENVDQQRLRQCIAEEQQRFDDCQRKLRSMIRQLDGMMDGMYAGYDNLFGTVIINGQRVPTVVGGSLFNAITVTGSGTAASTTKALLAAAGEGMVNGSNLNQALNSGNQQAVDDALGVYPQSALNNFLNGYLSQPQDALDPRLKVRSSFSKGWDLTNAAANLYKCYQGIDQLVTGLIGGDTLADDIDLQGDICLEYFQRIRALKNCNKGSNAWVACFGPIPQGKYLTETEKRMVADMNAKSRRLRAAIDESRESFGDLKAHVEGFNSSVDLLREAMDLSVFIDENRDSMSQAELNAAAAEFAELLQASHEGLYAMLLNSDRLEPALMGATKALDMAQMARDHADAVGRVQDYFQQQNTLQNQGDAGVLIHLDGHPGTATTMSGPGGRFVGYRQANAGRVGDTVVFDGGATNFNATLPDTLFDGTRSVEVPALTFEFTPFSTVEYNQIVNVGRVPMKLGVDDRNGVAPTVNLVFPAPGQTVRIPPGLPYFAKATARDDVVVFSTRFQLNGQSSEALGTTDFVGNTQPIAFSGYFLAPKIATTSDADGIAQTGADAGSIPGGGEAHIATAQTQTITVVAEAIDSGGNIGRSQTGSFLVDPDAPLLATVTPPQALAFVNGSPIPFMATVTATGAGLPSPLWFVEGIYGGNDRVGTISQSGVYTPPADTETLVQTFEIEVVSESSPELFGVATVTVSQFTRPIAVASVLNLILPASYIGREASSPVSVLGLFLPGSNSGREISAPVSVMGLFLPGATSGRETSAPVSILGLFLPSFSSGREVSDPVAVDNAP